MFEQALSYLTAWPSRDLIVAAHQQITDEWWRTKHRLFELFASQLVLREVQADADSVNPCSDDSWALAVDG